MRAILLIQILVFLAFTSLTSQPVTSDAVLETSDVPCAGLTCPTCLSANSSENWSTSASPQPCWPGTVDANSQRTKDTPGLLAVASRDQQQAEWADLQGA